MGSRVGLQGKGRVGRRDAGFLNLSLMKNRVTSSRWRNAIKEIEKLQLPSYFLIKLCYL